MPREPHYKKKKFVIDADLREKLYSSIDSFNSFEEIFYCIIGDNTKSIFAEFFGVTRQQVDRYINEEDVPSRQKIKQLTDALGMPGMYYKFLKAANYEEWLFVKKRLEKSQHLKNSNALNRPFDNSELDGLLLIKITKMIK